VEKKKCDLWHAGTRMDSGKTIELRFLGRDSVVFGCAVLVL